MLRYYIREGTRMGGVGKQSSAKKKKRERELGGSWSRREELRWLWGAAWKLDYL